MQLSQKFRIFPTAEQEAVLWALSEKCRLTYNFALAERIDTWEKNKEKPEEEREYITYIKQQNNLPSIKKQYPEYNWVYSKVLQSTLRKLAEAYKSFFAHWNKGDKNAHPPRFKGKYHFTTMCYNQSGFKIEGNTITFSHKHPSKVKLAFRISDKRPLFSKIKQVELFRDKKKRWFVSVTHDVEIPPYIDNDLFQAFDLGIANIASGVNTHCETIQFQNNRPDKYWKPMISEVQSKRDHCKKFSRRWYRYNKKLVKMKSKLTSQMKDYQHWVSRWIIDHTMANTIIIGNLNVMEMARKKPDTGNPRKNKANKTLNHSLQNTGSMGRFATFLEYKARLAGKRVVKIDECLTTQVCCCCGRIMKRALSERIIDCNCGNRMDRDLNSAINIMIVFLLKAGNGDHDFLLPNPSVNGESFLDRFPEATERFAAIHRLARGRSSDALAGSSSL
ncbi:MAG: RNA-guided endonuclease InsQ/TnpB family protein [Candidatus Hodarchaeota archaeon]